MSHTKTWGEETVGPWSQPSSFSSPLDLAQFSRALHIHVDATEPMSEFSPHPEETAAA